MGNMKKVIVFCECGFTREGIEALIKPEFSVISIPSLTDCHDYIMQDREIDLIILSFLIGGEGVLLRLDALTRLCALLKIYQSPCKVLVNFGYASAPILRFYFNHLEACFGLIDFKWSVSALKETITGVLTGKFFLPRGGVSDLKMLKPRERSVLRALIMELPAGEIAYALNLSVKTISSYKRAGLSKLGTSSIQGLLLPSVCKRRR